MLQPLLAPHILVDMDLSKDIFYEVLVEREGFAFPLAIEYEGLPDFCKHCKSIGHNVSKCRWLYPRKDESNNKVTGDKGKSDKGKEQIPITKPAWKPLKDNPLGTGSSKAFAAPPPSCYKHGSNYFSLDTRTSGFAATCHTR